MSGRTKFGSWVRSYRNGFGRRPGAGESGPIVLRIADVSSGHIDLSSPRHGMVSSKEAATYRLEAGDLLFVRVNGAREIVGRCAIVDEDLPHGTIFNDHLIRVQLKPGLDSEFARYCMSTVATRSVIEEAASTSAGQLTINQHLLDSIELPAHPLREQRRIAARLKAQLAAVEDAREAAHAQLREMECLETTIIENAFVDVPDALKTRIGNVAKVQSGYAFKSTDFKTAGVRLLRNTNMLPGRVYWDDAVFIAHDAASAYGRFALKNKDVLISLDRPVISSGLKIARIAPSDLPSLLVQRVGRFLLDDECLDGDYLYAFMRSRRFIEAVSGHEQSVGVPHVSPGQIEEIEIPLPSVEVQRRVAQCLSSRLLSLGQMRHDAWLRLTEIERLPARLLAAAFHPSKGPDHD